MDAVAGDDHAAVRLVLLSAVGLQGLLQVGRAPAAVGVRVLRGEPVQHLLDQDARLVAEDGRDVGERVGRLERRLRGTLDAIAQAHRPLNDRRHLVHALLGVPLDVVRADHLERLGGEADGHGRTDVDARDQLGCPDAGLVSAGAEQAVVGDLVADRERDTVRRVAGDVPREAVGRRGDGGPDEGDAHLAGLLHHANGQLTGLFAVVLVHEQLVALIEHDDPGPHPRVLQGQLAGQLRRLAAELLQQLAPLGHLVGQRAQPVQGGLQLLLVVTLDQRLQPGLERVVVHVRGHDVHLGLNERVEDGAEQQGDDDGRLAAAHDAADDPVGGHQLPDDGLTALRDGDRHALEIVGDAFLQQRPGRHLAGQRPLVGNPQVEDARLVGRLGRPHLDRLPQQVVRQDVLLAVDHLHRDADRQLQLGVPTVP